MLSSLLARLRHSLHPKPRLACHQPPWRPTIRKPFFSPDLHQPRSIRDVFAGHPAGKSTPVRKPTAETVVSLASLHYATSLKATQKSSPKGNTLSSMHCHLVWPTASSALCYQKALETPTPRQLFSITRAPALSPQATEGYLLRTLRPFATPTTSRFTSTTTCTNVGTQTHQDSIEKSTPESKPRNSWQVVLFTPYCSTLFADRYANLNSAHFSISLAATSVPKTPKPGQSI